MRQLRHHWREELFQCYVVRDIQSGTLAMAGAVAD
jgi:hypothetical protein